MDYVKTGIPGADEIMAHQGVPRGHNILVAGGPGSGKTTFAMQFLYKGATEFDEPGIYVSLDENPDDVRQNMLKFGWDFADLEKQGKISFVNVSPVRVAPTETGLVQLGMKEFKLVKLLDAIKREVKEIDAKRVVVDPITMFMLQYPDEIDRIYAMRDLIADLRKDHCTNLLVSELRGTGVDREHQFEEYLVQGVVLLRTLMKGSKLVRIFQVEKMRGLAADNQPRPYNITDQGVEIYHTLAAFT